MRLVLRFERLALWPWTWWEMSSSPRVRSFMSSDITDFAPAESIFSVVWVGGGDGVECGIVFFFVSWCGYLVPRSLCVRHLYRHFTFL